MIYSGKAVAQDLYSLWFMPVIFTIIYYGGDVILERMTRKRHKENFEADFLVAVSDLMQKSNAFLIEDFRKLQMDQKFQDSLKIAFFIYQNGENEQWTLAKLEKKFRPETIESKAMEQVINYVKEKRDSLIN